MCTETTKRDERDRPRGMSRCILCPGCKHLYDDAGPEEADEITTSVSGQAVIGMRCDACNKPVAVGETAWAVSSYWTEEDYYAWEGEYLMPPAPVKPPDAGQPPPGEWVYEGYGSRYLLRGASRPTTTVVGWDAPMRTFFAQVWEVRQDARHQEEGELLLWLGTSWGEISSVEQLAAALTGYVVIPCDLRGRLEQHAGPNF